MRARTVVYLLLFSLWVNTVFRTHPTLFTMRELVPKDRFDLVYGPWGVVFGASEGIGLEWSFALAERGVNVVLVSRDAKQLEQAYESLRRAVPNLQYKTIALDLNDVEEVRNLVTKLAKEIQVGIMIYNAAYSAVGPFASYKGSMHERAININVHSPLIAVSTFLEGMMHRKRGGIVLMSSVDGEGCSPQTANYAGTKAWATRFAEALWYEVRPANVHVLGVVAGMTTTRSLDGILMPEMRAKISPFLESTPRHVVMEGLAALGRDSPIVITGFGSKIAALSRWFMPRFLDCEISAQFKTMFKPSADLSKFAETTTQSDHRSKAENKPRQEL